jgi:transcriptional regulator with XRE-family HTH domain
MSNVVKIHASKQPRRPHFIPQWTAKNGMSQADLARKLEANKGVVSRWFSGASPGIVWQKRLADLFKIEAEALFREPEDDRINRLFTKRKALKTLLTSRTDHELDRIEKMLEAAFPDQPSPNG